MNTKFKSLATELYAGKISTEDFIDNYFVDSKPTNEYLDHLIDKAINERNADIVDESIVLLFTGHFGTNYFLNKLCHLLKEKWHTKHEDIVMLLSQQKSPETVDCIFEATEDKFQYLDYDDTYQFARKCIKALSSIGDKNAIDKLKLLTSSRVKTIADYAVKELRHLRSSQ